jgi:CubicO group peptidase (beta-lactamase class C family)
MWLKCRVCLSACRALVIAGVVILSISTGSAVALDAPVYPGRTWEARTPATVGMQTTTLTAFAQTVGGRGCVVRCGYMVYAWGDADKRSDVASACKPVYVHFLLKAVEDGRLKTTDEPVRLVEPRLDALNAALDHKDRRIRWRDLAYQTSCYGVRERPAQAYDYSDYNMALLFDTLFLKVYGSTWATVDRDVFHPMLTDPLQCQDNPTLMAFGTDNHPGRLAISPRDFARFGLLYARHGNWKGTQLISPRHARMAVTNPLPNSIPRTAGQPAEMIAGQRSIGGRNNQTDHLGSYSWAWWTNGADRQGRRHWPDAPLDTYGAFGHGGIRAMIVIPSLDLVVSWNDAQTEGRERENQALKLLVAAVATPPATRP